MEYNKVEIKMNKRLVYAGDVLNALIGCGWELPAATNLLSGVESANDKVEAEIDFWRLQCTEMDREISKMRAQLDMVHLIFGGNRNV